MCCCGTPVINGQFGYRWQSDDAPGVRPVNPPDVKQGETIIYDEPGRCGGLDSHCHHYRVTQHYSSVFLLVRHGGGDERLSFGGCDRVLLRSLAALDSNNRYWMLNALYHAASDYARVARQKERNVWQVAAMEKRIKVRKGRGTNSVTVTIKPKEFSANLMEESAA